MEDFCASQQLRSPGISILWQFMPWKVKSQVVEISSFYGMISYDRAVREGEEKDGRGDGGKYLFYVAGVRLLEDRS
jgi:hypothetical protein